MLNLDVIQRAMVDSGLSPIRLAEACSVSRESVSNWLSGESIPRPNRLKSLSAALGIPVKDLIGRSSTLQPVVAFRSLGNKPVTAAAVAAAEEVGMHLRQLVPFLDQPVFSPRRLANPTTDHGFIAKAAAAQRDLLKLGPLEVPSIEQIVHLLRDSGASLLPVLWGKDKHGHENALSVFLPESPVSWVVFNLGCYIDDIKYWLCHELGHCLTLHTLQQDAGEQFAEKFAQCLLVTDELAIQLYKAIQSSPQSKLRTSAELASKYEISILTVVRTADAAGIAAGLAATGLDAPPLYAAWKRMQKETPTLADKFFGTDLPSAQEYVETCEKEFGTLAFHAIEQWQLKVGGTSPSFIASALNINITEAFELAHFLAKRQGNVGAAS